MPLPERSPGDLRVIGIVSITLGIAAIALMLSAYRYNRDTLAGDRRDVAGLERQLDSVRGALLVTVDSASAARLREEVGVREYGLSRRAYHVPLRAESVRTWWHLTGPGTLASAVGVLLIALGAIGVRSARRGGSGATGTPRHDGS